MRRIKRIAAADEYRYYQSQKTLIEEECYVAPLGLINLLWLLNTFNLPCVQQLHVGTNRNKNNRNFGINLN